LENPKRLFFFGDFHGLPLKKHHKPSISDKNDESVVEEILNIYPHQKNEFSCKCSLPGVVSMNPTSPTCGVFGI
jgi:hypothetical protein